MTSGYSLVVIAGLDPAIQGSLPDPTAVSPSDAAGMDRRVKPGDDTEAAVVGSDP